MAASLSPDANSANSNDKNDLDLSTDSRGPSTDGDVWHIHKAVILRLYEAERRPLRQVMGIMATKHHFIASSNMYKKKFRQWKLQRVKAEMQDQPGQKPPAPPDIRLRHSEDPPAPRNLESPASLKVQERALRVVWNEVRRGLVLELPLDHAPVTTGGPPRTDRLKLTFPECIIIFQNSMGQGLTMSSEKGKAATIGALYEKAFEQVEAVIRTAHICTPLYLLDTFMESHHVNQPAVRRLLLTYLNNMAVKINGRDNGLALWTKCLLETPDDSIAEAIVRFTQAFSDSLSSVLGRFDYTSLTTRTRALNIGFVNSPEHLQEWEQLIDDSKQSPDTCDVLVWNIIYYLAQNLLARGGDVAKVESILEEFPERLKHTRKEDGLPMPATWVLITAANDYARAVAAQGKDEIAEETFRLAFIRCTQLLGDTCPLLTEIRWRYASFLKERGRAEETDRIYAEIDAELKDFMLEEKQKQGDEI